MDRQAKEFQQVPKSSPSAVPKRERSLATAAPGSSPPNLVPPARRARQTARSHASPQEQTNTGSSLPRLPRPDPASTRECPAAQMLHSSPACAAAVAGGSYTETCPPESPVPPASAPAEIRSHPPHPHEAPPQI